jgi:hypothetical protein
MEKVNVIASNAVSWKIVKPLNGIIMWNLTMTLLAGFVVCTYFFTNGYEIKNPVVVARNVSIPFAMLLAIFIYKWIRYKRNIDIYIEKISQDRYIINGKDYSVNGEMDYIKVIKYGNRVGSALFGIFLVVDNHKLFIVRDLCDNEYMDTVRSLSSFLGLKIIINS